MIHIETQAAKYGYADTLEIIKKSIKQYIPNDDISAADDKGDYPYPFVSPCATIFFQFGYIILYIELYVVKN